MAIQLFYLYVFIISFNIIGFNASLKSSGKYNIIFTNEPWLSNENIASGHLEHHILVTSCGRSSRIHGGTTIYTYVNNKYDTTALDKVNKLAVEFNFEVSAVICNNIQIKTIIRSSSNGNFNFFVDKLQQLLNHISKSKKAEYGVQITDSPTVILITSGKTIIFS